MTIGVSVPEIIYNASGLGPYAIPFAFKNKSTIKVEVQNSLGLWNDVTTFIISGASLTFSSLYDPVKIRIYRQNDINQNQGLKDFEDFPAQLIEASLDKITEIAQENAHDIYRTLKMPPGQEGVVLPSIDELKNKLLGFTAIGRAIGYTPFEAQSAMLAAYFNQVLCEYSAITYGVKADAKTQFGVWINAGSNQLHGVFEQSDIGKAFVLPRAGAAYYSIARGLTGTIIGVSSDGLIATLSVNAVTTVSTATYSEVIYGTDDTLAWTQAIEDVHKRNGGSISFKGHSMISGTLNFEATLGVRIRGDFVNLNPGFWHYAGGNYLTGSGNSNFLAKNAPSRLIWAGDVDKAMVMFRIGRRDALGEKSATGTWAFAIGGLKGVLLDAAGATCTCVALRGSSACKFEDVTGYRTPARVGSSYTLDADGIQSVNGTWDLGTAINSTFYNSAQRPVDSSGHLFINCWAFQRGTGIGAQIGWYFWGDRQWGNFCECDFIGGGSLTDDSGAGMVQIIAEQADSCTFVGFTWNGEFVLNAQNTGARSYDGGVIAPTTGCQTRSFHFSGYSGLIRAKGFTGTLPGGINDRTEVSANGIVWDCPLENIDKHPIIEQGGDVCVRSGASPSAGGLGAQTFGLRPAATCVYLTSNQSMPNGVMTLISWHSVMTRNTYALNLKASLAADGSQDFCWKGSDPTKIWVPNNVKFARVSSKLLWDANGVGQRFLEVWKNGAMVDQDSKQPIVGSGTSQDIEIIIPVQFGDYIQTYAMQNSGAALNLLASGFRNRFCVEFF